MSSAVDVNCDAINRKCGEIILTMKKNSKNVYSYNCWFCDTICIQMKKFTMHLEKEHEQQLEQPLIEEIARKEENNSKLETFDDDEFLPDIKVEECLAEVIKSEDEELSNDQHSEHDQVTANLKKDTNLSFLDPLETENDPDKTTITIMANKDTNPNNESTSHIAMEPFIDINLPPHSDEEVANEHDDIKDISDYTDDESSTSSDYKEDTIDEGRKRKTKLKISAEKEKELTVALIDAFKNFPKLWDTSQGEKCSVKQKDELLQNITENINTKLNMNLKRYTIKKKLSSLCKAFENELKEEISNIDKSREVVHSTKLWYYEQMDFLKTLMENKLKHKRKKPNQRVKPLSDPVLNDLIDIYKNYNSLWDVNHLAFTIKEKRLETMKAMLDEINTKMNLSLDIYKLEKHLSLIHKSYATEKKLRIDCEKQKRNCSKPSLFSFLSRCEFLEQHQGPFLCVVCSEVIDSFNDFQIHRSTHDASMPFKCQECGMGFKKISNYTIHAKRHLRVFKFHCEVCGKGYPFNAELDLHMRSHTGAQPYLCSICGEGFRTAISYDNHIRRHEERFKYFCHICKKGFNHMTRLNDHVKAHLNVRDVICTVCGKGFTSRKYLNHHKRIHEGKNYNCNICGKSFAQDAGLRAHKKYHGTPIGVSSIQKDHNKYNL